MERADGQEDEEDEEELVELPEDEEGAIWPLKGVFVVGVGVAMNLLLMKYA